MPARRLFQPLGFILRRSRVASFDTTTRALADPTKRKSTHSASVQRMGRVFLASFFAAGFICECGGFSPPMELAAWLLSPFDQPDELRYSHPPVICIVTSDVSCALCARSIGLQTSVTLYALTSSVSPCVVDLVAWLKCICGFCSCQALFAYAPET